MNILIIGGGLCGIVASALLHQNGVSHDVVESGSPFTGSRASSGILNPVMGRKRQLVPYYDILFPECRVLYSYLENLLGINIFLPVSILEFISGKKDFDLFQEKALSYPAFLETGMLPQILENSVRIQPDTYMGITQNAYVLCTAILQKHYLDFLRKDFRLIETRFQYDQITKSDLDFCFNGKKYTHMIFCNGKSFPEIPVSVPLPMSVNKGQALLIKPSETFPGNRVLKFGKNLTLCPYGEGRWWAGASFEWNYETETPTADFALEITKRIQQYLKCSFEIVQPLAGFRVSATDRKAIADWLPENPRIGILNAMGTKGVLQVPGAAAELVNKLLYSATGTELFKHSRFNKV